MTRVGSWALGYFVNSLWMVPLVFAAAWVAARAVRRVGPQAEHKVWVAALLAEAALPGVQMQWDDVRRAVESLRLWGWGAGDAGQHGRVAIAMGEARLHGGLQLPHGLAVAMVAIYMCSVLYFGVKLAWGLWKTHRMGREAQPMVEMDATVEWWEEHCARAGVEEAVLRISERVHGPATVGMRRGVLVVPAGFFDGMEESEVETVMAHECAHIKRHDFLKNLLYSVAALPVAFHPLLWVTRARLVESREMVCDAMAAEAVAGQERYAWSLLRLASRMVAGETAGTFHAIGIFDANSFERRVMSLMRRRQSTGGALRLAMLGACVAIGATACASALALRVDVAEKAEAKGHPLKVDSGVIAGQVVYQKRPVYPAEAKANHDTVNGPVVLDAVISKEGLIERLRVKQSLRADYDRSALEAVKDWKYQPYLLNGEPVDVETTITVNFSIEK